MLGIDIGGTFTDIIIARSDGELYRSKVASTFDPVDGIVAGIADLLKRHEIPPSRIVKVVHASTVATNTILEHKGARTALLVTRGFRDVLEIGRLRRPTLFDIMWEKPKVLVRRQLRLEVDERINFRGEIEIAIDVEQAKRQIDTLQALNVESVAVCLLHSYKNSSHEECLGQLLEERLPGVSVSLSYKVLPEIREFERTSTTVVNAYIRPVVERYFQMLEAELNSLGIVGALLVMQSNGGMVEAHFASARPVTVIESGPAAGVLAATYLARHVGIDPFIAFDMGGTTAKASMIEGGEPKINPGCEVGAGMNASSRLSATGAGYPIRVPSIDIAEVGSGGGSIAWIDRAGALRLGPVSAGATPGPACYGKGQLEPTVTDANVVLGYMSPQRLAGGLIRIDRDLACRAVKEKIADPLRIDVVDAALGIHLIANASMAKAVHAVTTERGRDPREFSLICFGGSGPVHGAMLALTLGMPRVVVPVAPGLFSAVGLLFADVRHDFLLTVLHRAHELTGHILQSRYAELTGIGRLRLENTGTKLDDCVLTYSADLRYAGQSSEVTVLSDPVADNAVENLIRDFEKEYALTYGHHGDRARIELVNIRLVAVSPAHKLSYGDLADSMRGTEGTSLPEVRKVYFGRQFGYSDAVVL
ncbi:MAG: hydantoinase/oxoprolinase family protein, partial [Burkholderiales bacterium]